MSFGQPTRPRMYLGLVVRNKYVFVIKQFYYCLKMQVPKVNVIYRVTISEIRSVIDQRARITIERINNIGMA